VKSTFTLEIPSLVKAVSIVSRSSKAFPRTHPVPWQKSMARFLIFTIQVSSNHQYLLNGLTVYQTMGFFIYGNIGSKSACANATNCLEGIFHVNGGLTRFNTQLFLYFM